MKRQEELNDAWCKYRGKCSADDLQVLKFALQWCDEHPHWISVEDEMPKKNEWVFTCNGEESINLLMLAGNGMWYDKAVGLHVNVTHWMPLPPAPEKGGKK